MKKLSNYLKAVDRDYPEALNLLKEWVSINSGSENLAGLKKMLEALNKVFAPLGDECTKIALEPWKKLDDKGKIFECPLGEALTIEKKRPNSKFKILFAGHMDTVFSQFSTFQNYRDANSDKLIGPGAADMKGGLIILYLGLKTFEESPYAEKISWEIVISPDEEIGSPGSRKLFEKKAKTAAYGLLFEPAYSDGAIVGQRKGSANFTVLAKGKPAHAGRDFLLGRSAITALARFIVKAEKIQETFSGVTINVGHVQGGGPINIVPDFAYCRINIRFVNLEQIKEIVKRLEQLIAEENRVDGIDLELHQELMRPPKPFDQKTQHLYEQLKESADELDEPLFVRPSGGVSDGNTLAAAGLPNLDTLGAIGGGLHTHEEYIFKESLITRAKLLALFLMKEAKR